MTSKWKLCWIVVCLFLCLGTSGCVSKWQYINDGFTVGRVGGLAVDSDNHEEIVLVTESGVWRTTNLGQDWVQSNDGLPFAPSASWSHLNGNLLATNPNKPRTLYAPFNKGLYRTTDFGTSWTSIFNEAVQNSEPLDLNKFDRIAGAYMSPRGTLFAGTIAAGRLGGLFRLNNNSEPWELVSGMGSGQSVGNDAFPVAVNRFNEKHMFSGGPHPATDGGEDGFKQSTDGGITWKKIDRLKDESILTIWQDPSDFNYWLVSGLKTYELRPKPGQSILERNNVPELNKERGLTGWRLRKDLPAHVYSFSVDTKGAAWAGTLDGLYTRKHVGQRWKKDDSLGKKVIRNIAVVHNGQDRHFFAGTEGKGLFYSLNDEPFLNISDSINARPSIYCFDAIPGSSSLYAGVDGLGVFVKEQTLDVWQRITPPINFISDIAVKDDMSEIIIGNAFGLMVWDTIERKLHKIVNDSMEGAAILVAWDPGEMDVFYTITLKESKKGRRDYAFHRLQKGISGKYEVTVSQQLPATFVYDLKVGGNNGEAILVAGENLLNQAKGLLAWNRADSNFQDAFKYKLPASITEVEVEPDSPARVVFVTEQGDLYSAIFRVDGPQKISTMIMHNGKEYKMKAGRPEVEWAKDIKIYIYDEDAAFSTAENRPNVISYHTKTTGWVALDDGEALNGEPDLFDLTMAPWDKDTLFLGTFDRGVLYRKLD